VIEMAEELIEFRNRHDLPDDLAKGITKQDDPTLQDVIWFCDDLIAWQESQIDPEEVAGEDEEIVDTEETSDGAIVKKMISCGKETCQSCKHGPYAYRAYREGDKVKTEYLGPATEA